MIFEAILNLNTLIHKMLNKIIVSNKPQRDFFIEIMFLFLSVKGKLNFLQFGRYGKFGEQRYRQQFEKEFDFLNFNKNLILSNGSGPYAIAFDPSYISKSGTKTYGRDKFWSGVAGVPKFGLEIGGIAAIDMGNHTAFHLEALQTPDYKELKEKSITLLDWYANILIHRKDALTPISKCLVADAYFSKQPFVDKILLNTDFHLVSRLRIDANLKYLSFAPRTGKPGRPTKFAGKINLNNIDKEYFSLIENNEEYSLYQGIVYSKSLKRNIKLVYQEIKNQKEDKYLLFFSTDHKQEGIEIYKIYKSRFQIEFLYRDGKQHTGLTDCQARGQQKLHFHFNASLTAINLAKVEHWLSLPKQERGSFSMANIKTLYNNILLLERFIDVFAVPAYKLKNIHKVKELINWGKIAA